MTAEMYRQRMEERLNCAEQQLSEAKAEIERLNNAYARQYRATAKLIQENDTMEAEIERLQAHNALMLDVLARASTSLGSFCSDEGWAQSDMDTMDAVDAAICGAKNSYVAQQWLSEQLAQARKDALLDAARLASDDLARTLTAMANSLSLRVKGSVIPSQKEPKSGNL